MLIRLAVYYLLEAYFFALIIRIVLSYFPTSPGSSLSRVTMALDRVTEPVLAPVRRVLPPFGVGGVGLDLSPLIILLLLQLVIIPIVRP